MKLIEKPESYNPEYRFFDLAVFGCQQHVQKTNTAGVAFVRNFRKLKLWNLKSIICRIRALNTNRLWRRFFATLDSLGEEHRSAFLLRYREGFSIKEVAEILELPEGNSQIAAVFMRKKLLAEKLEYLKDEIEF